MFLAPQSVSALEISSDGRFIAVTTMAFRHDRNLWLISAEGKLLWGHYLSPWAPFEVAVLPGARLRCWTSLFGPYRTLSDYLTIRKCGREADRIRGRRGATGLAALRRRRLAHRVDAVFAAPGRRQRGVT